MEVRKVLESQAASRVTVGKRHAGDARLLAISGIRLQGIDDRRKVGILDLRDPDHQDEVV